MLTALVRKPMPDSAAGAQSEVTNAVRRLARAAELLTLVSLECGPFSEAAWQARRWHQAAKETLEWTTGYLGAMAR